MTDAELDEQELNTALEMIDTQLQEKPQENFPVEAETQNSEISIDEITKVALDSYKDIQAHSDEIYSAFYGNVATRIDRSDSSKQMLVESQRLKIESINALASLAGAKAKLIAAQQKANSGSKMGVIINTQSGNDVGINLANLAD